MAYDPPPGMDAPYSAMRPAGMPAWQKLLFGCLGGCAILLVLLIIGGILALRGAGHTFQQGDQVARQFLGYIQNRQFDQAYNMTSTGWRRSTTPSDFKDFADFWLKQQGRFVTITQAGWYVNSTQAGTAEQLTYRIHGSRRDGRVLMMLVNEGGKLRVQSCNYAPAKPLTP